MKIAPRKKTRTQSTTRRQLAVASVTLDADTVRREVERVAYGLYEQHGHADGKDQDHWLQAEAIVRQRLNGRAKRR